MRKLKMDINLHNVIDIKVQKRASMGMMESEYKHSTETYYTELVVTYKLEDETAKIRIGLYAKDIDALKMGVKR